MEQIGETEVLSDPDRLRQVLAELERGGVVGLPTDTVYGLAARLDRPSGIERLFVLKERPEGVPIAILVADEAQAWACGRPGPRAVELVRRHWPGALTVIVDALDDIGPRVGSNDGSVGVRCPDRELVRVLAARAGPLATTSANRHGHRTPRTAGEVAAAFPELLVVDGGPLEGAPSTVVDARRESLVVLRAGDVDLNGGAPTT